MLHILQICKNLKLFLTFLLYVKLLLHDQIFFDKFKYQMFFDRVKLKIFDKFVKNS